MTIGGGALPPGETYLSDTPVLRAHAGTQPDLYLCWNDIPLDAATIDVAVHLHGFSQQRGEMLLSEKAPRSGLDLSGRSRPTLGVLPRGNWIRSTWYDFPALLDGGLDTLVADALEQFGLVARRPLALDRLILSGHSGGGMPAIDAIAGAVRPPDELYVFDGLYGRDPSLGDPMQGLEIIEAWLAARFSAEPERPGALRVVYIERQTGPFSREVQKLIAHHLAMTDPETAPGSLWRRYRVEQSGVPHGYVAAICQPQLLTDAAIRFDWTQI
ncbi:MAG TPA: hypothetical protein VHY35_23120 [Stellaceae bacterium]|jgi:hypothetical protein|nr:hypothetical protein [Stellaceae bacterium]